MIIVNIYEGVFLGATRNTVHFFSPAFQEMGAYIASIEPPFSLRDIEGFNAVYKRSYYALSREERLEVEAFVDTMIEQLDHKTLASRIYGVV